MEKLGIGKRITAYRSGLSCFLKYENRIAYCEKGERRKRTHRLVTRGAAVESVAPTVKALTEVEFYAFVESIFALPEVQTLLAEAIHDQGRA